MRHRHKRVWILLPIFLALAVGFLLIRKRAAPIVERLAVAQAENTMSAMVNNVIEKQIADGNINYDRMIYFEKDVSGTITALKTNMGEMNRLKTEILGAMNREIEDISVHKLEIPVGNIIFPELFSGKGFSFPIRILSVGTSDASFENRFSEAGINQTLHQIYLIVCVDLSLLTPTGSVSTQVTTDVAVAETVIVGSVPQSYFSIPTVNP